MGSVRDRWREFSKDITGQGENEDAVHRLGMPVLDCQTHTKIICSTLTVVLNSFY